MKFRNLVILTLSAFLLSACNTATTAPATEAATEAVTEAVTEATEAATEEVTEAPKTEAATEEEGVKAADFLSEHPDRMKSFVGDFGEFSSFTTSLEYRKDNRFQYRVDNGGLAVNYLIEKRENSLVALAESPEMYFRQNLVDLDKGLYENWLEEELVYLKDPVVKGESWKTGKDAQVTILDVVAPEGEHKTRVVLEVLQFEDKTTVTLEEGFGLVEQVQESGDRTVTAKFDFFDDGRQAHMVSLFFPDDKGEGYVRKDTMHAFVTNSITRMELEEIWKKVPGNAIPVLSENAKINSLYPNQDGNAYIDLNRAFVDEMNAGSTGESLILDSVAYTVGAMMGGEGVILTIDGEPYSGGHVTFDKGEAMQSHPSQDAHVEIIEE